MVKKHELAGCQAGAHRWEAVRFTENYRRCWKCERVEVCVNDHWQLPTATRKRRSSSPYAEAYIPMMWTTLIGVSYQDLQIRSFTPLFGSRSAAPTAVTQLKMVKRVRIGQLLEAAGKRGYPDLSVYLPGERRCTINSGLVSWQLVCEHGSQEVIDGALGQLVSYKELPIVTESERTGREALVEYARGREWRAFACKMRSRSGYESDFVIGDGEEDWKRFAYRGYYDQVLEVCKQLGAGQERAKRDAVLIYGEARRWHKVMKKASEQGEYVVFGEEGEEAWRRFASQASYTDICRVYDLLVMYEGPLEMLQKEMVSEGKV
jgi:hypothetical protein